MKPNETNTTYNNDEHNLRCKKLSYISQTSIDKVPAEFLKSFHVSKELIEAIKSFIKEIHDDKQVGWAYLPNKNF